MNGKIYLLLIIVLASVMLTGCDKPINIGRTEPYIQSPTLDKETVIPNQEFTVTYLVKNPSQSDRDLFLEISLTNYIQSVNFATGYRLSLGTISAHDSKSFYNSFRVTGETDKPQNITLKLYSTKDAKDPLYVTSVPVVVATQPTYR